MEKLRKQKPSHSGSHRQKRWAMGCYRLGVILAALACLWALPRDQRSIDPARVLAEAKSVLSSVVSVGDASEGFYPLLDSEGNPAGWATSTFPQAENVQGYSGPSELLVVFDTSRRVRGVRFLTSEDTDGHVRKIRDAADFWEQWTGKPESSLGDDPDPMIVSGATLTSEAMARGLAARFGAMGMDQWFPEPLKPADIAKWFPSADRIGDGGEAGSYMVFDGDESLGTVLRSSHMGVSARGFNGISDVIVVLSTGGEKVLGIALLGSRDNEPYVGDVGDEVKYADGFAGKSVDEVIAEDSEASPSLFTSGASLTNYAVVESVQEMLRRHRAERVPEAFPWKSSLAIVWIALGVFCGVSKWGRRLKARIAYAVVSVAAGIGLGWMVSQDQLLGWGANGFDVGLVLPLLVLTAVALVVPAFTGKNVYCNRICPHGAAQTLAGQLVKKRFALPPKIHSIMVRVPWLTLTVIWVLAFLASGIPLAYFEPFESWSSGFVAFVPASIFTIGLVAAFFLPQAYCHYGCPTGALLRFLTHAPGRWTARDSVAGVLVVAAVVYSSLK